MFVCQFANACRAPGREEPAKPNLPTAAVPRPSVSPSSTPPSPPVQGEACGRPLPVHLHSPSLPSVPPSTIAPPSRSPCCFILPQCKEKPADDPYQFTHFAHELNSCEDGINPLPSDSRRRPDRALLELGNSSGG